tara:strand:+ start:5579 stop:6292 length:714 start_codon:yes stop_codon:yes gene_type:complete
MKHCRLGVNIDHVATLREQRKENDPNLLEAAKIALKAGADIITIHLREDRRHIQDKDVYELTNARIPLNFECAATPEMLLIAKKIKPQSVCIVPEKREELTTEGGLDLSKNTIYLEKFIKELKTNQIKVSLFVDPNEKSFFEALRLNADCIEVHTGQYAVSNSSEEEIKKLKNIANLTKTHPISLHAGHGLNFENIGKIINIEEIEEVNIGHSLIADAIFNGLETTIKNMKKKLRRN